MKQYKIRVNNEAESREAQELFFELGYAWQHGKSYLTIGSDWTHLTVYSDGSLSMGFGDAEKELTLPQLRDLVVLHRNDVKDANFKLFISPSQGYLSLYKASDDVFYVYAEKSKCWDKSRSVSIGNKDLEPIHASKDDKQGLISGADALRALVDGKEVEAFVEYELGIKEWQDAKNLPICDVLNNGFDFRPKPRTVKLEIEVPDPFEPKDGELFWHISPEYEKGYSKSMYDDRNVNTWQQFGAWRTEAEIKIVVEQVRRLKELGK